MIETTTPLLHMMAMKCFIACPEDILYTVSNTLLLKIYVYKLNIVI